MKILATLRDKARALKRETMVLYFAVRDRRTPLMAKLVAGLIVAYALSPIDLIPDFIPVLGYLDEVILLPLGIAFALRLVPQPVIADARRQAETVLARPKSYAGAAVIVLIWIGAIVLMSVWGYRSFGGNTA